MWFLGVFGFLEFLGFSRVLYGVFLRVSRVFLRFFEEKRWVLVSWGFRVFKGFVWGFLEGF